MKSESWTVRAWVGGWVVARGTEEEASQQQRESREEVAAVGEGN